MAHITTKSENIHLEWSVKLPRPRMASADVARDVLWEIGKGAN